MNQLPALKTPDKIVGGILAAIVVGFGLWGATYAVPILVELAKNTIYLIVELVALGFLLLVFGDKETWRSIMFKWKNISRNIRKAIIREDPIGVLDTLISRFERRLEEIQEGVARFQATKEIQNESIKTMQERSRESYALAQAAQKMKKSEAVVAEHAKSGYRWDKAAKEALPQQERLASMLSKLEQAQDLATAQIRDLKEQKEVLQIQLTAMLEGQKTVRLFKRLFGTDPDLTTREMTLEEIQRQSAVAEAEIDQFMRVLSPKLAAEDLRQDAEALEALETLNPQQQLPSGEKLELPTGGVKDGEFVHKS